MATGVDERTPLVGATEPTNSNVSGISGIEGNGGPKKGDNNATKASETDRLLPTSETVTKNRLGTINGVYTPCLLNILGVILFERLGWGVGQLGAGMVMLIFVIGEFQTVTTTLSLSAIVTNGNMRGGGSYYMISRTLGAEFGGSIGILFYAAYCVGVAFYCTGCAEEIVATWYRYVQIFFCFQRVVQG